MFPDLHNQRCAPHSWESMEAKKKNPCITLPSSHQYDLTPKVVLMQTSNTCHVGRHRSSCQTLPFCWHRQWISLKVFFFSSLYFFALSREMRWKVNANHRGFALQRFFLKQGWGINARASRLLKKRQHTEQYISSNKRQGKQSAYLAEGIKPVYLND